MSPRDWRLRIEDILDAIDAITSYTGEQSFEGFAADRKTIDAVVRNLEVIGEAARHVPDAAKALSPGIPWLEMGDMRNVLVHEYFGVDLSVLWKTIRSDLPALVPTLRQLLERDA